VPTGASLASTHFAQPTQPPYVSALSVQNVFTNRSCIQIGAEPPYRVLGVRRGGFLERKQIELAPTKGESQ
jgi:hypothetical protein